MIDLDQLAARWEEQERRLDRTLRLNAQLVRELELDRARASLLGVGAGTYAALAVDVALLVGLGGYVGRGPGALQLASALALAAFLVWSVITGARQVAALHALDYGAPVVSLQKQLEALRAARIHKSKWIFLLAPLLWTPLLVVALGLVGVDAGRLGSPYLVSNLAFGLACIPALRWLARRPLVQRSRLFGRIADDLAGRSLARARARLASLAAFEE